MQLIHTQADEITVLYNEKYGYPVTISIDYDAGVADEEFIMTLDYFAPYQAWQEVQGSNFHNWKLLTNSYSSYQFIFQRFCECTNDYSVKLLFRRTVSQMSSSCLFTLDDSNVTIDLSRASSPVLSLEELNIPTIDQLFDILQEASTPFALRVNYNPIHYYPSEVTIDYDEFLANAEYRLSVYAVLINSAASHPFLELVGIYY